MLNETKEEASVPLKVGSGTHVQVELVDEAGDAARLEFDIVPDAQADFSHGFLGIGTPLAQAILGQTAGSAVPYRVGDMAQARILSVTLDVHTPSADIEAKRQAVLRQALAQAEQVSDMAFALAVGSKWGDYDPGGAKEE
jgi:hypothetical protein